MQAQLGLGSLTASPLVRGAFVGLAATQALDALSIYLYERESPFARFRENRTRGFLHAYERAVVKVARATTGTKLSRRQAKTWGWRFHKTFGVLSGVLYALARRKNPGLGAGGGLALGAAFFVVADEVLMPLLGLTPGPRKFGWKVHARGAVSHVAYGVAAELTWRAFQKLSDAQANKRMRAHEPLNTRALPTDDASFAAAIQGITKDLAKKGMANVSPARLA